MKADRNTLVLTRPAAWHGDMWRTGLAAGNGITGALMYGAISDETILLNRYDLWYDEGPESPLPDMTEVFQEMREDIDHGRYAEADWKMVHALKEAGYNEKEATPLPLGVLKIKRETYGMFYNYNRGIKMDTAEVFTQWELEDGKHARSLFVSREDDIVYMDVESAGRTAYCLQPLDFGNSCKEDLKEEILKHLCTEVDAKKGVFCYLTAFRDTWYGAILKVIGDDLKMTEEDGSLVVDGERYVLMIKTFSGADPKQALCEVQSVLNQKNYSRDFYQNRLEENLSLYAPLYQSVSIELAEDEELAKTNEELLEIAYQGRASAALIEKLWRFGRYLFISGTCEHGYLFPLYGLWHGDYHLCWAQNVANQNVQMIYRHADPGALSYADKDLISYYYNMIPAFRENAKKLYGCRGIFVPAYTTPGRAGLAPNVPVITNWISAAGWLAAHFYRYYKYTGDKELLREQILPFMYETALFYEDYALYDESGTCMLYPSVSPENTPNNLREAVKVQHPHTVTKNPLMDFAILRELLLNLIELTEEAKEVRYLEKIPDWKKLLEALPEYMVNSDGAVKEWLDDSLEDYYCHRHLSHIYPVFPGNEITPDSDKAVWDAFRKAVDLREIQSQSGWSLAHMGCIYARFGMGKDALECLDLLAKGCLLDNFFTLHNDWRNMGISMSSMLLAPVQLDAIMGAVDLIQELAMRYANGTLYILPAFEERLKNIRVQDLRFPGGAVSFAFDEEGTLQISIDANQSMPLRIVAPNAETELSLEAGKTYRIQG